jgi:hypothetical protein
MSNNKRWYIKFKEFAYALNKYCEENKDSKHHYPPNIVEVVRFAAVISNMDCSESLGHALNKMFKDPSVQGYMKEGLIITNGNLSCPGPFFRQCGYELSFDAGDTTVAVVLSTILKSVSDYAKSKKMADSRYKEINMYLTNTLAEALKSFLVTSSFDIPKDIRDTIAVNTKIKEISLPYENNEQETAIRGILKDAIDRPKAREFLEKYLGTSITQAAVNAVDNVNAHTFHTVKEGFDGAIRARSIDPIFDSLKNMLSSVASNNHAQDGISGQSQE